MSHFLIEEFVRGHFISKNLKLNIMDLFMNLIQTNLHLGKKVETRRHLKTKKKTKQYKIQI